MEKLTLTKPELQIIEIALVMTNGLFDKNQIPGSLYSERKLNDVFESALNKISQQIKNE